MPAGIPVQLRPKACAIHARDPITKKSPKSDSSFMVTSSRPAADPAELQDAAKRSASLSTASPRVALLTGGSDRPYVYGLATAMVAQQTAKLRCCLSTEPRLLP